MYEETPNFSLVGEAKPSVGEVKLIKSLNGKAKACWSSVTYYYNRKNSLLKKENLKK